MLAVARLGSVHCSLYCSSIVVVLVMPFSVGFSQKGQVHSVCEIMLMVAPPSLSVTLKQTPSDGENHFQEWFDGQRAVR